MMEKETIEVGMAEFRIGDVSKVLVTRGLGSCVGIIIYDPQKKLGALAHAMLPSQEMARFKSNPAKFVDSVIPLMIEKLKEKGASLKNLKAKLFGGAHMFSSIPEESTFSVGRRNVEEARKILNSYGIEIVAEDVEKNYGRTIFFDVETGKVKVKTIFFGEKEL